MSHLQYFSYKGFGEHMREVLSYSQAVRGWDLNTRKVHTDLGEEVNQAFANVELALKDAGGRGWSQVYRVRIFIVHTNDEVIALLVQNFQRWMPDHKPVFTCVGVNELALEGMRIEIEAFAHDG
ncbi:Endoribonuclease L-PSP/chorismate mutase-like protein [Aspergillus novoparasiticus]|uniref:Endoribonuclease L-PSP/chorismate mutase-like protein n=1 Tax=Aspergillus novoparasiticus TaxID=986946 RepID=A0A5N6EUH5_9EURO|nr:Endoribonuclease L-PSP/chorismate mutase-like protein [Aspergillus novoparasiticus]